jgi:DNA replication protein DnaC
MDANDLELLTDQIQDETGLDRRTAERIALTQLESPGQVTPPITAGMVKRALTAPPTPNEPVTIPTVPTAHGCPDCGGAGWYKESVPHGHPSFGKLFPCQCTLAARDSHLKDRRLDILSKLQGELGGELSLCRIDSFELRRARVNDPESRKSLAFALSAAREFLKAPRRWLYFYGPTGVGKSHLASAIAIAWADGGIGRVAYASAPALLRYIRTGYKDDTADDRLIALQLVDLLILDDLGTEYHKPGEGYSHTDSTLFELIADRYTYDRPTIITSNLAVQDLEPRIGSRIKGKSRLIYIDNEDQRGRS